MARCNTVGLLMAAATVATAAEAKPLELRGQPTGSWTIDFAEERCVALREYGAGDSKLLLAFEPAPHGKDMTVILRLPVNAPLEKAMRVDRGAGQLALNGKRISDHLVSRRPADPGLLISSTYRPAESEAPALDQLVSLEMRSASVDARLPLSGMTNLAPVLAKCNQSLLASFGLAEADQQRLARWPESKAPIVSYIDDGDYPADAIRNEEQGRVLVRFWVSAEGLATSCAVRQSSGSALLDRTTCEILQRRARFDPARDKAGAAMAAPSFAEIRWVIPR
ncbi:energy transducer TonB [Sphingomonas swuensis]